MNEQYKRMDELELMALYAGDTDIASRLLKRYGSIREAVIESSESELESQGLDYISARSIKALLEVSRRLYSPVLKPMTKIYSPQGIYDLVFSEVAYASQKTYGVVCLGPGNTFYKFEVVSVGTINYGLLDSRLVFKPALDSSAVQIIIVASGIAGRAIKDDEDVKYLARLKEASKLLGIPIADFIVIAPGDWLSFRSSGLL